MSDDATFTQHIQEKCSAMKSKISWVLRTFRSRARVPMLTLWKTQVLCHLDYCSQLWSPHRIGSIQMLEAVQKTFYSKIDGMYHLSYWQQLAELKTYSLERRRERYRILYLTEIHMTFSTTVYQLRYIFFIYRSRFNIPVVGVFHGNQTFERVISSFFALFLPFYLIKYVQLDIKTRISSFDMKNDIQFVQNYKNITLVLRTRVIFLKFCTHCISFFISITHNFLL